MHYAKFATRLLAGTAIVAVGAVFGTAHAQDAGDSYGVNEIIVTAQKREQSIQDVPIAVTAISGEAMKANKIEDVTDLTGLVPGLVMRNTAGSLAAISFAMRGVNSNPSAPLQDKQIAVSVDGVYIGGSRGTLSELMEVERIEVLRGPQGTLFGRNSTAGAINVVTRNPTGDMAFTQMVGYGNEDQIRTKTTIDTPAIGPLSAYVTYLHDESRGDVRNLGAGVVWDRTNPFTNVGRQTSPKWVGGRNYENVFAALRFDNGGDVTATYKFDWSKGNYVGDARVTPVINPSGERVLTTPLDPNGPRANYPVPNTLGTLLLGLIAAQPAGGGIFGPITLNPGDRRPDAANQSFTTPGFQRVEGHSFVVEWNASDSITVKNTFGYRRNGVFSGGSSVSGLHGLQFTPAAVAPYVNFIGASAIPGWSSMAQATKDYITGSAGPLGATVAGLNYIASTGQYFFAPYEGQSYGRHRQMSDEIQVNYSTDKLNLTTGLLYFEAKTRDSGLLGFTPNIAFAPTSTTIALGDGTGAPGAQRAIGTQKSYAAYGQVEYQFTDQLGVVAGGRYTKDEKSGLFQAQGLFTGNRSTTGTMTWNKTLRGDFTKSKFTYSLGVNYKPNDDTLLYAKYATGFLSGGLYADLPFEPEYAKSWEAGFKLDLLDKRVRFNVSAYKAEYVNAQATTSGRAIRRDDLPIAVISLGTLKAKGVELELNVTPIDGFLFGGTAGYTKNQYGSPPDAKLRDGYNIVPTGQPRWVGAVFGQYVSQPVWGDASLMLRADMIYQSKSRVIGAHQVVVDFPVFAPYEFIPNKQIVNGRIALRDVDIGGGNWEFALWGKNLLDNKKPIYPFQYPYFLMTTQYEEGRKYGIEVTVKFGREEEAAPPPPPPPPPPPAPATMTCPDGTIIAVTDACPAPPPPPAPEPERG